MKEHESREGAPPPRPAGVRVAVNRCPYCRADVEIDAEAWVSCWRCQARHHAPCWAESSRCASCGCDRAVGVRRSLPPLVRHGLTAGALVLGIVGTLPLLLVVVTWIQIGRPDEWGGPLGAAGLAALAAAGGVAIQRVLRDPPG